MRALGFVPGTGITVAATGSSVSGAITMTGCDAIFVTNTSTTLHVSVAQGVGAPTATLAGDLCIPPGSSVLIASNATITHVAAIGSAAGPTAVMFMPIRRGG
jgi:hypothetical protein